jgi:hypothetical protein
MSETSNGAGKRPRAAVNLGKSSTSTTGESRPGDSIAIPRAINLACAALGTVVLGMLIRAIGMNGSTATMRQYLIDANKKAKTPKKNYDPTSDLQNLRHAGWFNVILLAVIVGLLIWSLRRTRSASMSRWILIVVMVFMQLPLLIIPGIGYPSGLPPLARVGGFAAGLFAIVALGLVFVPRESQRYFRACRELSMPPGAQRRPGLFGPRPPRGGPGAGASTRPATTRPAATRPESKPAPTRPAVPRAKAKGRADADAVAKGAELARSRAKANKSRRNGG